MRVLALDPGKLVGWAHADIDEQGRWHDVEHGIHELKESALWIADEQRHEPPNIDGDGLPAKWSTFDVIVYEDWRLYRNHAEDYIGSDMPYSQYIGMVRLIGWLSATKVVSYGADKKTFFLKSMASLRPELYAKVERGLKRRHDDSHDMDALIHLWGYTFSNYPVEQETR